MIFWIQLLTLGVLLTSTGCRPDGGLDSGQRIPELQLVNAFHLETPGLLEPSGLTLSDGVLYTVADKVDHTIYRIEVTDQVARLVPHIRFKPPQIGYMDWEGITTDLAGSFYLISENHGRLLQVTTDGTASWASPDLRVEGRKLGLFAKNNAGFEGVAWLGPNHWLGAAEREMRGLVEWWGSEAGVTVESTVHNTSPFLHALPLLRLPDYSGLHADGDKVYALFRNAHLVVRLEKREEGWTETAAWSYRHIETAPELAYRAQAYGQAEGLVVDGDDVYLIFDNNLGTRQAAPNDRRPLFVHARFPGLAD